MTHKHWFLDWSCDQYTLYVLSVTQFLDAFLALGFLGVTVSGLQYEI